MWRGNPIEIGVVTVGIRAKRLQIFENNKILKTSFWKLIFLKPCTTWHAAVQGSEKKISCLWKLGHGENCMCMCLINWVTKMSIYWECDTPANMCVSLRLIIDSCYVQLWIWTSLKWLLMPLLSILEIIFINSYLWLWILKEIRMIIMRYCIKRRLCDWVYWRIFRLE